MPLAGSGARSMLSINGRDESITPITSRNNLVEPFLCFLKLLQFVMLQLDRVHLCRLE
jgi:hypothetical protein